MMVSVVGSNLTTRVIGIYGDMKCVSTLIYFELVNLVHEILWCE